MADVEVTINSLTVVTDAELEKVDSQVADVMTATSVDNTVGEVRRWILASLASAGVAEAEVAEDNGDTGLTSRQEILRPAAEFRWMYAALRYAASGDPNSWLMQKAEHYRKLSEAEMKLVVGPPLLLGTPATAESATSLGRPTAMRIGP